MRTTSRVNSGVDIVASPTAPYARRNVTGCFESSKMYCSHGRVLSPYLSSPLTRSAGSVVRWPLSSTENGTDVVPTRVSVPELVESLTKFITE